MGFKIATDLKEIGTAAFKAGDYELAQKKYLKSLRYLDLHLTLPERDLDFEDAITALRLSLLLNSALTGIKSATPAGGRLAIKQCTRVLGMEGDSIREEGKKALTNGEKAKSHYRRAMGYLAVKEELKAIEDLKLATTFAPEDTQISLA